MTGDDPLGADNDTAAIREVGIVTPCHMRQQYPFDFAWCETHDEVFPLGAVCRFHRNFPAHPSGDRGGQ